MAKKKKSALSFMLVLAMAFTLVFPVNIFAESYPTPEQEYQLESNPSHGLGDDLFVGFDAPVVLDLDVEGLAADGVQVVTDIPGIAKDLGEPVQLEDVTHTQPTTLPPAAARSTGHAYRILPGYLGVLFNE